MFERFGTAFVIIGLIVAGAAGCFGFFWFLEEDELPKGIKRAIIIGSIVALIGGIIPSKETCYKMIVASYVTPANIESVKGEATDLIDYIIEKVDELTDNEESD